MFHGWYGSPGYGAWGYGFPWGGLSMGILVVAIIAMGIVFIVRSGRNRIDDRRDSTQRGIDILIERFSRGEIDGETFKKMKAQIEERS
jgi:uncharacterized membrane protein